MTDGDGLLEMGEKTLVAVDAYLERTEGRLTYRQEHGRTLSKAHLQQLADLRQRIDMIIDPPADTAVLRGEFEALCQRLEAII